MVFHHAALGSVPASVDDPVLAHEINVTGTLLLLDACRRHGVRRIVLAASSAAYGEPKSVPIKESHPTAALSPYGASKLAGEAYLMAFAHVYGLETVNLRYFNIFGPGQRPDGAYAAAIPRFIDRALRGQPIEIFGDGEQTRDFCYVDNVVQANLLAASRPAASRGEPINIAGGRRITLNALCDELRTHFRETLQVTHGPARNGDIRHSFADISAARDRLGFEPRVTWEQGLAPTIEFLKRLASKRP